MSFLDLLQTVGGRLGILETPSKMAGGDPEKITTRTVTLEQLKSEIQSKEVQALADLPAELAQPFPKIFEAAGVVQTSSIWNVARLVETVTAEPFRSQERGAAQRSLLGALGSDQVRAEDLVREAMAQDQALDAFEAFVCKKVEGHITLAEHRAAELDAKIQALQSERAQVAERLQIERAKLREWRLRKRIYERELASAIGYLTDRPVITTDDEVK